jgi:asparagine synthase (glutamine-hydrolysing)
MLFRYCAADRHLLKNVQQLPPGYRLCLRDARVTVSQYWQISDPSKSPISFDAALERLDHLLRDSVKSQLLSDVKVGCQLSGGIDSSLVSVFARKHFDADMDTFSVIFDDPAYSEEPWIDQAARRANAVSHRFTFTDDDFFDNLDRATWHLDQPLNHPNSLGINLLARRSRETVTVLLSGEGADELFGGYLRYYYAALRPRIMPWLGALNRLPRLGRRFASIFGDRHANPADLFIMASAFQQPHELLAARPNAALDRPLQQRRDAFAQGHADHITNCLKYDLQTYLVDLLVRQDKMTMSHSLENRVPFLDRHLVDFVRSLPPEHLVGKRLTLRDARMRNTKIILKRLAARVFDDRFVYRPKSGFSLPLKHYYAQPRFRDLMEDRVLPGVRRRDLVREDVLASWWRQARAMSQRASETLWVHVAFELWAQRFLDHPAAPASAMPVTLAQPA